MKTKPKVRDIQYYLNYINESKILAGLVMLAVNIGSKYIEINFTKFQEHYLRNTLIREMLIFSLIFMATHDIDCCLYCII
jgi:hypothetical protein